MRGYSPLRVAFPELRESGAMSALAEQTGLPTSFQCDRCQHEMREIMRSLVLATGAALLLAGSTAFAADESLLPPQNAQKLSAIIAKVEQRDGFRYVKEVDWDKDGYTVTYYTADKAKVEITFDPVTAEPK
jgi:hypothetical protein